MSESLSQRVARYMQAQPARRSGKARAAVVAMREGIQKAVDDGWSVKAIWETLHADGSLQIGYHAFRRYVAELLTPNRAEKRSASPAPLRSAPAKRASDGARVFQHERVPQKKDIYG